MGLYHIQGYAKDPQGRHFAARQNRLTKRISIQLSDQFLHLPKDAHVNFASASVGTYKSPGEQGGTEYSQQLVRGTLAKMPTQPKSLDSALLAVTQAHTASEILRDFCHPSGGSNHQLLQQHIRDRVTEELAAAHYKAPEGVGAYLQSRATRIWGALTQSKPTLLGHSAPVVGR
jgi:hypothetical protein